MKKVNFAVRSGLLFLVLACIPAAAQYHWWMNSIEWDPGTGIVSGYAETGKWCCWGEWYDAVEGVLQGPGGIYQYYDYTDWGGWYDYVWVNVWDTVRQSGIHTFNSYHGYWDVYIYLDLGDLENWLYLEVTDEEPTYMGQVGSVYTLPNCGCEPGRGGVAKFFDYQVYNQYFQPIRKSMSMSDSIVTGSPNTCNIVSYVVTPPGMYTRSDGTFQENLYSCLSACGDAWGCNSQSVCTTGASQTWYIDGYAIGKTLFYHCDDVEVF